MVLLFVQSILHGVRGDGARLLDHHNHLSDEPALHRVGMYFMLIYKDYEWYTKVIGLS